MGNKTEEIKLRVSPQLKRALKEFCAEKGKTMSDWLMDAAREKAEADGVDLFTKKSMLNGNSLDGSGVK